MWPSTMLSSAATAASASAIGSPASAARSSMAESSKATASPLPARTGTPQRSANALAISDPPCRQSQPYARQAYSRDRRTSAQAPPRRASGDDGRIGEKCRRRAEDTAADDLRRGVGPDRYPGPAEQPDQQVAGSSRYVTRGQRARRTLTSGHALTVPSRYGGA